ncbi:hypothetical protein JTE90_011598 [Oedothorax gibbosus]|uniref:BTB domain-containing protein n=1 Tax=Oedothorax gibbosus TaxID=931172 RepID=A0AAV6U6S7_9ARAC|nr:hypothetical protein JTE90_011598 [Oedothorax gibbosus]
MEVEKDCTTKCRSSVHAEQILCCVLSATPSQIKAYCVWLCHNFSLNSDKLGRNLLHIASVCGKWEIVEWLIKQCKAEIDVKDLESGWTALHRSFYYGQLVSARVLCMNGANLKLTDHEGFTPLDIILKDRLPYIEYLATDPCDVYAWGSNFNYNLGIGNSNSKNSPEVLEVFRKDFIDIKQVEICKFHSIFLSMDGRVFTCGLGHGGRLGQDSEDISLVPSPVKGLHAACVQFATGQDHLMLLLENNQLWTCGLNTYHQLGHTPPPERLLVPKGVSLKFMKGKKILGLCAARYHSVIYTIDGLYSFGLNAGQLGHPKGDRTQIHPRQVSALNTEECHLTHVTTSDGAIVCSTSRGDVYVLHEYQIRKIASRQLEISKLSVVGGHLDSRCDVAGVREGGGLELRVALLTKSGKLYLWRQTDPYLRRCIFTSQKELIISDIHINHYSIGLITSLNEAYLGNVTLFKSKRAPPSHHAPTPVLGSSAGFATLLNTEECHFIKAKKVPNVYRGTTITSDYKGRNFAVLQSNPKMGLVEIPMVSDSKMQQDLSRLFVETHKLDDFHDIIIKVEKKEFAAHRYILASRSEYFRKQFSKEAYKDGVMQIEYLKLEAFEQALKFIYTNHCDFFTEGYEVKWIPAKESTKKGKSTNKATNPIIILQEVSKKLHLSYLTKRLDSIKIINGKITVQRKDQIPCVKFSRLSMSDLCDVNLISSEGTVFGCHKCILISRLDYFHSMLSTCWAENSLLGNLSLPISSKAMQVLLDYIYEDDASKIEILEDVEFLCHILMIADQLLIPRLKEVCESAIVKLINLRNAAELLELSSVYNSVQLKRTCMQFICLNLATIIESRILEVLSEDVIEELSSYYQNLVPSMKRRTIKSLKNPLEDLEFLEKQFPVSETYTFERTKSESHETKTKSRKRCSSLRSEAKDVIKDEVQSVIPEKNFILDIVTSPTVKSENDSITPLTEKKQFQTKNIELTPKRPSQWILKCCPKEQQLLRLNEIMMEEFKLTPLQKKFNVPDKKPIPHLSQKQKKMLGKQLTTEIPIPSSPPDHNSCPWAKLPHQSPPSPSFWEAVAKKDLPPSFLSRDAPMTINPSSVEDPKLLAPANSPDIVISLHEIQMAEERKLRRAINPVIKPLHILNIEDQAIEELSELYNAKDNPKEKIIISRVQAEDIASPIWRRRGH